MTKSKRLLAVKKIPIFFLYRSVYCKTVANRADYEEEVASDLLTAALQLLPIFLRRQYFTFFTRLFVVLVLYSPYLNIEFHAFFSAKAMH